MQSPVGGSHGGFQGPGPGNVGGMAVVSHVLCIYPACVMALMGR